jgi:hypothetical protein
MAPVWVLILVGLGSGVLGTLISTLLRLSHEREAELRLRMLTAADDFAVDALRAQVIAEETIEIRFDEPDEDYPDNRDELELEPEDVWSQETIDAVRKANETRDLLDERAARIRLLFGDDSDAAKAVSGVLGELSGAISVVEAIPQDPKWLARGLLFEMSERRREFNDAARSSLAPRRWVRGWRRRRAARRDRERRAEGREQRVRFEMGPDPEEGDT